MKMNKDMTPFDMVRKPSKQYPFLMPLLWIGSFIMTRPLKLKISKINMKGIKPPFLVIASHQGFTDYYIGPLSMFPHRAMYVSDMEGFAAFGKWLYRGLGCIGKRRYVPDINVVRHMKYAIDQKQSVFVYPESRHSNVGTTSYIPKNMGRLCKIMNVPVVVLTENGSYLANPFWDEEHTRKVPVKANMTCIYTKEELKKVSAEDIQKKIEKMLIYNEYDYQKNNNIRINYKKRAEGLNKALYQCIKCGAKYEMRSKDSILSCKACGSSWFYSELGELLLTEGDDTKDAYSIPKWYEWEREQAVSAFSLKNFNVKVEALPSEKGFVDLGEGTLKLNETEFVLKLNATDMANEKELHFPHCNRESVQTEYNYKGKGMCIVLSTEDCCYYIYSDDKDFNPTELQFIGEHFFLQKNVICSNL